MVTDILNKMAEIVDNTMTSFQSDFEKYDRPYIEAATPEQFPMLWVGPDGHGKKGAPYRLTDVVKDMEQCEQMIKNLSDALSEANNKEILWEQPNS